MKNVRKTVTLALATLMVLSLGTLIPVKADTYVDVDTTSNVQVIISTDGSVSLYYNSVNIQGEINSLRNALQGIALRVNSLATRNEVNRLNQTVYGLIGELDEILGDLFVRTNYLAVVLGVNTNSSEVEENLKQGRISVAEYIESILETLDFVTVDIETLDNRTLTLHNELQNFENYVDNNLNDIEGQFNKTYVDMEKALNSLYSKFLSEMKTLQNKLLNQINDAYIELDLKMQKLANATALDLQTLSNKIDANKNTQERKIQELEINLLDTQRRLYHFEIITYLLAVGISVSIVLIVYISGKKLKVSTNN